MQMYGFILLVWVWGSPHGGFLLNAALFGLCFKKKKKIGN